MRISLLSVFFPPLCLFSPSLHLLPLSLPPPHSHKLFLNDIFWGLPSQKTPSRILESNGWWRGALLACLSVLVVINISQLNTPLSLSQTDVFRGKHVSFCVSVCLRAVCFSLLLQAIADIGYLSERSAPDCLCEGVCVIVVGEPSAIKRHQNICRTVSRQEGEWIFSWWWHPA